MELYGYVDAKGDEPFNIWLEGLADRRARHKIYSRLNRLRQGHFGDCKCLRTGVYELRIHYAKGYRVYFARSSLTTVLLLMGGIKVTQAKDIDKAIQYYKQFKSEQ